MRLTWSAGRIVAGRVEYRHPVDVGTLLRGRRADSVPELFAALFAICREAQRTAAALACAAAAGTPPPPERRTGVLTELGREHARRLLLDWPSALGLEPWVTGCRVLLRALDDVDRAATTAALDALSERCAAVLLGGSGCWPGRGPLARLLEALEPADAARAAPAVPGAPRRLTSGALGALAELEPLPGYETGAVARRGDDGRLAAYLAGPEGALRARVAARGLELLELADWLRGEAPVYGAAVTAPGTGQAWVETARGLLAHRVVVGGGRVREYRLLAPTDWHFGPLGPLEKALAGTPAADPEAARRMAGLAVLGLDPCVPAAVTVA